MTQLDYTKETIGWLQLRLAISAAAIIVIAWMLPPYSDAPRPFITGIAAAFCFGVIVHWHHRRITKLISDLTDRK